MVSGRGMITGVALIACLAALSACTGANERELEYESTEPVAVTEIRLIGDGSGDFVVTTTPGRKDVQVNRVLRYRTQDEPKATYQIDGTTLIVSTDCGRWCDVSYRIDAPAGVAVNGTNSSGTVSLTGVGAVNLSVDSGSLSVNRASGAVQASVSSGSVEVVDAAGKVDLQAESGSIAGRGLTGPVAANTDSGDIDLTLRTAAAVTAHADSGELTVTVPDGSYRVRTKADSGEATIEVADDPAGTIVLDLSTDSGDLSLLAA